MFTVRRCGAGGSDRPKEVFDLTGHDLTSWAITQGGHDQTAGGAATPAVSLAWLGEQAAVVPQRGGLGALDVVEPAQVLRSQLPEAHPAPATLFGVSLEQGLFRVVLVHERQHPLGRLGLGQYAVR